MSRRRDERGQATVLIVGFFLVLATMVAVVTDASAAYLQRQRLDNLADGAALAAADALSLADVYAEGLGATAQLDPAAASAEVETYLRLAGADLPGLRWEVGAEDARVVVRLSAPLELPLGVPGVADAVPVTATAAAVASLG